MLRHQKYDRTLRNQWLFRRSYLITRLEGNNDPMWICLPEGHVCLQLNYFIQRQAHHNPTETCKMYVRTTRMVLKQLGGSNHRPVKLSININIQLPQAKRFPRWSYKKANWILFEALTDTYTNPITTRQKYSEQNAWRDILTQLCFESCYISHPQRCTQRLQTILDRWTARMGKNYFPSQRNSREGTISREQHRSLKEATAKYRMTCTETARTSWQEKNERLNLDKDGNKLWKLAKPLNNENTRRFGVTVQRNSHLLTEKKAANHFILCLWKN